MNHLISASQCLKQLKADGIYSCSAAYFSQLVSEGKFPKYKKPNSPKDWFKYEEVVDIVKTFQSVSLKEVDTEVKEDNGLFAQIGSYPSEADMSEEELKEKLEKEREYMAAAKQQAKDAGVDVNEEKSDRGLEVSEFLGKSLNEVKIQKEYWLGKKAEIEYKRQMGEVVSIDEVNQNAFETARLLRDKLLGISARLTPVLASEEDHHVIRTLIDEEINRALKSISETIYE